MNDFNLWKFLIEKNNWSINTFGHGQRTEGVIKHIEQELEEVRENPEDLMEWIDVILLAFDGAFRSGHTASEIVIALETKQQINTERTWEKPTPDSPSHHKED